MGFGIWASQNESHLVVCDDARLHEGGNVVAHDTSRGQAGWDLGLNYSTLDDLISQIRGHSVQRGQATRLAINCHGNRDGLAYVDGTGSESLTIDSLVNFQFRIETLREFLANGANVLFAGCLLGQGALGSRLLGRLSEDGYFRGCYVHGFTRVGAHYQQEREHTFASTLIPFREICQEPGMHLTELADANLSGDQDFSGQALPWASESSGHRKTAYDGRVIYDSDLAAMTPIAIEAFDAAPFRSSPPPQRHPRHWGRRR